jgi:hypothetical protein
MRTLKAGEPVRRFFPFLFGTALIYSALFFPACETGFDPGSAIPLAAPRSIQVTAKNESLVLQWTKVAPTQGAIPSYKAYYSKETDPYNALEGEEIISGSSNLVQAGITGLENHTTYYVWVKAVYAGLGESDFSPMESGIPVPPPDTPGTLAVIPGEELLQVAWEDVEDAFTYEVYYLAGGAGDVPPAGTAMKTVSQAGAALSGLTNGTGYTLWVRALNTAGASPGYATGAGTPLAASDPPATPPDKPELVAGNGKLTLIWKPVDGVPSYRLYYGTTNDFSAATALDALVPASVPEVRADIPGLVNGTLYYVWVQSWNSKSSKDNSPASGAANGTPVAKPAIVFSDLKFELGQAAAEYIFAQDLPPSVFFPEGRPNTDRLTRVQETALGNLFTDGAAWHIRNRYPEENIDFVFLNGGYVDNALPKGTITVGGLSAIVKPDSRGDTVAFLTLTGADLKKFFEDVASRVDGVGDVAGVTHTGRGGGGTGEFGMVSKEVRYTLQYYKPPEGTEEISETDAEPYYHGFIKDGTLKINGKDIVDTQEYRICTTNYVASGVYFTILAEKGKNLLVTDTPFWRGVAEYIYDQGTVIPYLDGRVKIEGGVPLPPPWEPGDLIKP